jgi:hypothetical protein
MKITIEMEKGRAFKTVMVAELSLCDIMGLLIGRDIRINDPKAPLVIRNRQAYEAFNPSATSAKA